MTLSAPGLRRGVAARLAPLENRSFAALVAGRAVSTLGDGLYGVAVMWLVYDLTGSPAFTGLAAFLAQFPTALQALVGPAIDRADLRRALVGVELLGAALVAIVPLAAVTGHLSVWLVLATIPPLSVGTIVATPAQYTAIPRLLGETERVRGNGLFRAVSEATAALSRGVAGLAIATLGITALYAADAVTFLVAAVVFRAVAIPDAEPDGDAGQTDVEPAVGDGSSDTGSDDGGDSGSGGADRSDESDDGLDLDTYRRELREGLGLLRHSAAGAALLPSLVANSLFGVALAVLPAFAASVGGPTAYGLLLAGLTVGGVVGAALAGFFDHLPLWLLGVAGFGLSGLLWTGSVLVGGAVLTAALFGASRAAFRTFGVSMEAAFQTAVPEEMVGRVMAAASGATSLSFALGTLGGGIVGSLVGVRTVMLAGGTGALAASAWWAMHPALRGFGPPTAVRSGQFGEAA